MTRFTDGISTFCERKRAIWGDSKIFGLQSGRTEFAIIEVRKVRDEQVIG